MWLIANYGRLSRDEKGEKLDSKETQLAYNAQYVKDNNLGVIVDEYFDDDISGVTFDREDLDRLKEDIESGKINMIVTKDLSRLGRSNAKTLTFLEYLEDKNVRLIVINDHYDSHKDSDDFIGIKTWVNERYVKDVSVKIRSNVHQKLKSGEYLGTPPFGYKKEYVVVNNKMKPINKLIVDEVIRPIIIEVYKLYIEGYGYRIIADMMQEKGYPNPSSYKNYNRPRAERWNKDHVKRIVTSPVYAGDTVQGVSERISYKSKKTRRRPQDQWYITRDTHEPIIDRETWELANEINKKRAVENGTRNKRMLHLFSGFLECGGCGKFLCARKHKTKPMGYICSSYFHFGKGNGKNRGCESHHVREEQLYNMVLEDIAKELRQEKSEAFREFDLQDEHHDVNATVNHIQKEIERCSQHLNIAYEDRLNGIISVDVYVNKTKEIQTKLDFLKNQLANVKKEAACKEKAKENRQKQFKIFEEILSKQELTRPILEQCLRKIYVFLPGDIEDSQKESLKQKLKTTDDEIQTLKENGGLFIAYKF